MKTKTSRNLLVSLLAFLGIGAIGGGAVFIISPNGKLMGMPLSLLDTSPFVSFLIPGIILFILLGILPIIISIALIKKRESKLMERFNFFKDLHWSWCFSIYIAFTLILWLQIQMQMLSAVSWLHTFYMFFAVLLIFVALLPQVRDFYNRK